MLTKKWVFTLFILAFFVILTACYKENGIHYGRQPDNVNFSSTTDYAYDSERAYQTQQLYGPVVHNNKKLEYSEYLSNQAKAVNGVNTAIVMVTDHSAYVAILIDHTATNTRGSGKETNNEGARVGIYNAASPESDAMNPDNLTNGVNNYDTSMDHKTLSHRFKQTIAKKLRMAQPQLKDVYISANRDFVNQMNKYAKENWKGNSLDPYVAEFNQIVTQLFGTAQLLPQR